MGEMQTEINKKAFIFMLFFGKIIYVIV